MPEGRECGRDAMKFFGETILLFLKNIDD